MTGERFLYRVNLVRTQAACFSLCKRYRYQLRYQLNGGDVLGPCSKAVTFLMLNPSTADELEPDPTVRRCMHFARQMGATELLVANLFALRSTDPKALLSCDDPVGPDNDEALKQTPSEVPIVCGWGEPSSARLARLVNERSLVVRALLGNRELLALAVTKTLQPRHPLYLRNDCKPHRWPMVTENNQ